MINNGLNLNAITPKVIRLFYLLSFPVALIISSVIFWLKEKGPIHIDLAPIALSSQILFGIAAGSFIGLFVGITSLKAPVLKSFKEIAFYVFRNSKPSWIDITLTSVMAGFAEELLFRGTLQLFFGIWVASTLFTVAHVGGSKKPITILKYAALVFVLGLTLGLIYESYGLITAMITHAFIDFSFLTLYKFSSSSRGQLLVEE